MSDKKTTNLPEKAKNAESYGLSRSHQSNQQVDCPPIMALAVSYNLCDVDSLRLQNTTDKQEVACTFSSYADNTLTYSQKAKLGNFDLLLECLADYENDYADKVSKKVKLVVDGTSSPACVYQKHPLITVRPVLNYDSKDKEQSMIAGNLGSIEILAPSLREDKSRGWLTSFWNFNFNDRVKEFHVDIKSCGVAAMKDPVGTLKGRVLIYPNESWVLTLKAPAFVTISKKESMSQSFLLDDTKERKSSRSSSGTFNYNSDSYSSTTTSNSKQNLTKEEISYSKGFSSNSYSETSGTKSTDVYNANDSQYYSETQGSTPTFNDDYYSETEKVNSGTFFKNDKISASDATDGDETLLGSQEMIFRPELSLTLNGQNVNITKKINNILDVAKTIKDAWNALQNWAPKVGWSASLDVAFFEGTISGGWGYRAKKLSHQRISEVEDYYHLDITVIIFKVKAEVSFGIDIQVENWFTGRNIAEIILKISGNIGCSLPLSKRFSSGDVSPAPVKLSVKSTAEVKVIGRAALFDYTYEASVSIDGGIAFDGEFYCSSSESPRTTAKVYMMPCVVHITLIATGKKEPYLKDIELFAKKDLWSGTLLSDDRTYTSSQSSEW